MALWRVLSSKARHNNVFGPDMTSRFLSSSKTTPRGVFCPNLLGRKQTNRSPPLSPRLVPAYPPLVKPCPSRPTAMLMGPLHVELRALVELHGSLGSPWQTFARCPERRKPFLLQKGHLYGPWFVLFYGNAYYGNALFS